jgi:hypothetical protein
MERSNSMNITVENGMESSNNMNITVENGVKELVIRHGEAAAIPEPLFVNMTGTITASRLFFQQRTQHNAIDVAACLVTFSQRERCIEFDTNPRQNYADTVIGKLTDNPNLTPFKINEPANFTLTQLRSFLRVRRWLFEKVDQHTELMNTLNDLTLTANTTMQDKQDRRGNVTQNFNREVASNVPLSFTLKMPLFVGAEPKTFIVDVAFEVRDGGTSYWFESTELPELLETEAATLIQAELKTFRDAGCAVLEIA